MFIAVKVPRTIFEKTTVKVKKITLIIFSFFCLSTNAQQWEWIKHIYNNAPNKVGIGTSIGYDKFGNVYFIGSYDGYYDYSFYKFSPTGSLIWKDTLSNLKARLVTDIDGTTYIAGAYEKIEKYDSSGQLIWSQNTSNAGFVNLTLFPGGGIVVVGGNKQGTPVTLGNVTLSGNKRFFMARCDEDGNWLWAVDDDSLAGASVTVTKGKKIIEAGGGNKFYIKRYDENGNFEMGMAEKLKQRIFYHTVDNDGNIYVFGEVGGTDSINVGGNIYQCNCYYGNVFIVKYNQQGISQWVKLFSGYTEGTKIVSDKENNIYISGQYSDTIIVDGFSDTGSNQAFIVKMDSSGNALWLKTSSSFNGSGWDDAGISDMTLDSSENIFISGVVGGKELFDTITTNVMGYGDILIGKINQSSNTGILSINNNVFVNCYPNPTSGIFTVNLRNYQDAKICVYDVLGNCLWKKDCRNDTNPIINGSTMLTINLSSQPKGIYFMEIVSYPSSQGFEGQRRAVKKIVLE